MFKFFTKRSANEETCFLNRDVLVGIVKNAEQYIINTENNFYHIPAKRLYILDFPIRYIALFKSHKIFPQNEAGVFVYGRVIKTSLVKRREITQIPKDSDEEYYVFEVEEWKELKEPIKAQELSRTHTFTSISLLKSAKTVPELYMLCEEDLKLYRRLYELCILKPDKNTTFKKFKYNKTKIGFSKQFIEIIYPDTEHRRYKRDTFYNKPYALFNLIKEN